MFQEALFANIRTYIHIYSNSVFINSLFTVKPERIHLQNVESVRLAHTQPTSVFKAHPY